MADFGKLIRQLDLFRRIDEVYLTSATAHGATFTLISYVLMLSLAVFEFSAWVSSTISTTVLVDVNMEKSLFITFNITMLALPCKLVDIEMYDELGWSQQKVETDVKKTRIHMAYGKYIIGAEIPMGGEETLNNDTVHEFDEEEFAKKEKEFQSWGNHALDLYGEEYFDKELALYDYTLMNFYAPWCHWCKMLIPTFEEAAEEFDEIMLKEHKHLKAKFASLDCEAYGTICSQYKVIAYPTLLIFHHKNPIYPAFDGERTVESLVKFLKNAVINAETSVPETYHDHACRIQGTLIVPRVPGNFHIVAKSRDQDMSPQMANLSHLVHNLQFGVGVDPSFEHRLEKKQQHLLHPLNGKQFLLTKIHLAPQHYIQVVTTLYQLDDGSQVNAYQFTSQNRIADYTNEEIPEAKFSYAMSPVSVVITHRRSPFYKFITSLLAIVGGAFTMISLLNTMMGTVGDQIKKKIGKFN